jgi:hypothetical protein
MQRIIVGVVWTSEGDLMSFLLEEKVYPTNVKVNMGQLMLIIVNPSGKAGAQIPQPPLGDNSSPWGDNAVCT